MVGTEPPLWLDLAYRALGPMRLRRPQVNLRVDLLKEFSWYRFFLELALRPSRSELLDQLFFRWGSGCVLLEPICGVQMLLLGAVILYKTDRPAAFPIRLLGLLLGNPA